MHDEGDVQREAGSEASVFEKKCSSYLSPSQREEQCTMKAMCRKKEAMRECSRRTGASRMFEKTFDTWIEIQSEPESSACAQHAA
jgi:hypothetical protein